MLIENFRTTDFNYIATLPYNMPPQWGSMTLQHMVEHLADVFSASNGTLQVKVETPADKLEKIKRIMLFSDRELVQNFKSPVLPPDPIPYRTANMQEAISKLKHEMEKFEQYYSTDKNRTENHPYFGALNYDEWVIFQNKHFTHHLKQFNLL